MWKIGLGRGSVRGGSWEMELVCRGKLREIGELMGFCRGGIMNRNT